MNPKPQPTLKSVPEAKPVKEKAIAPPSGKAFDDAGEQYKPSLRARKKAFEAWNIKVQMDALKKKLDQLNAELTEEIGIGGKLELDGLCTVAVSQSHTPKVIKGKGAELEAILGTLRFTDLVKTTITHKPTEKLMQLWGDADNPEAKEIRECIEIAQSKPSVKHTPMRN